MGDTDNNPPQSLAEILQQRLAENPIEPPKPTPYRGYIRNAIIAGVVAALLLAVIFAVQ